MVIRYSLFFLITFIYSQNYYFSPGFNITFNDNRQVNVGFQIGIDMSYEIAHLSTGMGAVYSLHNKELRTYNFIGGGITFLRFEYGNVKLSVNGKSKRGKRTNLSFGSPYLDAELFHSIETSSLLDKKIVKQYNWIKFPILINK